MNQSDKTVKIQELKDLMAQFVKERDWEKFHSPKNLSMSIAIEAAELMEHFQWADEETALKTLKDKESDIKDELADIALFLFEFASLYKIDLSDAIVNKLNKNKKKYPTDLVKGKSDKYTAYAS